MRFCHTYAAEFVRIKGYMNMHIPFPTVSVYICNHLKTLRTQAMHVCMWFAKGHSELLPRMYVWAWRLHPVVCCLHYIPSYKYIWGSTVPSEHCITVLSVRRKLKKNNNKKEKLQQLMSIKIIITSQIRHNGENL